MKHFKVGDEIKGFEEDGTQDFLIPLDAREIEGDVETYIQAQKPPSVLKFEQDLETKTRIERMEISSLRALREAVLSGDKAALIEFEEKIKLERAKLK